MGEHRCRFCFIGVTLWLSLWLVACTSTPAAPAAEPGQTAATVPATPLPATPTPEAATPTSTATVSQLPTPTPAPSATPTAPAASPTPIAAATALPCPPWRWSTQGKIHPDQPPYTFRLVGMACDNLVEGHRIEIRRGEAPTPAQVIEGVFVANRLRDEAEGFEIVDMNFDGYRDIRLIDEATAGSSGVLYRHWLFDPQTGRFEPNVAMNQRIGRAEFDPQQEQIRVFWRAGAGGVATDTYRWIDGKLTLLQRVETQALADGVDLLTTQIEVGGQLVTQSKKVVRQQGYNSTWLLLPELGHNFRHLAVSSGGQIWAVGRDGLFLFDGQLWHIFDLPPELQEKIPADARLANTLTGLAAGPDTVWLGTRENGLFRFAAGNWQSLTPTEGLPDNAIRNLAVDAQNNLWAIFGTHDQYGLARFDGQQWLPLSLEAIGQAPNGVAVTPSGQVWLSVPGQSPYFFDGSRWIPAQNRWTAGSVDMFLAAHPGGTIWVGSDNGWMRWAGTGWQALDVTIPAPFSYPVAVDATGGAWGIVATGCYFCKSPNFNEQGAVYVGPTQSCRFTAADGLGAPPLDPPPLFSDYETPRPDSVWDIAVAPDGRVWFITQGQITVFKPTGPVCSYAAPENVRTPQPVDLNCQTEPDQFVALWQRRQKQLGCPTGPAQQISMAQQPFERGWMLWRGDTGTITALPAAQKSSQFEDTWDSSQPAYTCPELSPPETPPTPQRGFGKVWCQHENLRTALGQATGPEQALTATLQPFERGSMLATNQGVTYIFVFSDWERLE